MQRLLKFFAGFIFIIIIVISIILLTKFTKFTSTPVIESIKKKINEKPVVVNNKIIKLTEKQINQNALDLFNYKHEKFIKNLDNSIQFCIDNNQFLLADNVSKYKILYLDLYKIKNKLDKKSNGKPVDYNSNEEFLLKSIQMDNLNNSIIKMH